MTAKNAHTPAKTVRIVVGFAPAFASGSDGTSGGGSGGGVALDEVDRKTLESLKAPGLYFCGEVLDAWGPIGGHNFAWAWATGRAAGHSASL